MPQTQTFTISGFWPGAGPGRAPLAAGFRLGEIGTHSSRTIMLADLTATLAAAPRNADRRAYAAAIIEANCLGKPTASTRRLSNQRLGELYSLDPGAPLFRILRRLWAIDEPGRPLLALLAALARDPLLIATASVIIPMPEGVEFQRMQMKAALDAAAGERLKPTIIDKTVRNTASSWTQSGHLHGRTFKFRRLVRATAPAVAFALYLGQAAGFRGEELFSSGWMSVLDCTVSRARALAAEAKRLNLIDFRTAGDVVEFGLEKLDPAARRK